jgi:hypothetical protein
MRIIGLVLAALTLAGASAAHAAGPTHEWATLEGSFTWDDCGFPVEESFSGKLYFVSWFDDAGNRTRQLVTAPGVRVTWRNPQTGETVSTASTYVVHKEDNPDGGLLVAFTGITGVLTGGGPAYATTGRVVLLFSPSGIEEISSAGPSADLCEALIATIG